MALAWFLLCFLWSIAGAVQIQLLKCDPPDLPVWGGYNPQQSEYLPGDAVHYYCDVDTFIGGSWKRVCEDTGKWTHDTPVCDSPAAFISTEQTSDADPDSTSRLAVDGLRTTCSATKRGNSETWYGNFTQPGQLIRVMIFLPKGFVSYEVVLVKENGEEVVCDSSTRSVERYEWFYHNCPEPHNVGAAGLKIKSLINNPLKICEIAAYVLTSPKCVDPRVHIENGRLRLSRTTATLVCDRHYTRSPDSKLECVSDGVWNRKNLFCEERQWEVNGAAASEDGGRNPDNEPNIDNRET